MMKYLLLIGALFVGACGGAPSDQENLGSVSEPVFADKQVFVRKGITFPDDPLRNPLGLTTNPNDMGGSVVTAVQINKVAPGAADSGQYSTDIVPRASISVQISEYDAIKTFVNSAASQGRQVVLKFKIANVERRGPWATVGAPTWTLRGVSPVTAIMNVFPGRRANHDPAICCFWIDWDTGSTPGFETVEIERNPGFYEGADVFTPNSRMATVFLNDTGWNHMATVLDDPTHNARVQITYEDSATTNDKPLLGLPLFTNR